MVSPNDYIAVFDSGVGGISVLRHLRRELPREKFLYFGDSANAPYGTRPLAEIRALTVAAADMLLSRDVKALVVACNTATSAAIVQLREKYPDKIIIGIEPALKLAADRFPGGSVNNYNKGIYREPHSYTCIYDYKDRLMIEKVPLSNVAISEYTAHHMRKCLSAVVSYGTGGSAAFRYDIATAGKTGTTTNDHDRWFIGFTPYYVAACWVGYDIPKPMSGVWGNPAITPWKAVMSSIHTDKPAATFERPSDLLAVGICNACGKLATDVCWGIEGAATSVEFRVGYQPYNQCVAEECHAPEIALPELGNSLSDVVTDSTAAPAESAASTENN